MITAVLAVIILIMAAAQYRHCVVYFSIKGATSSDEGISTAGLSEEQKRWYENFLVVKNGFPTYTLKREYILCSIARLLTIGTCFYYI